MDVDFTDSGLPPECYGEIDDMLQRLAVGDRPGQLPHLPEEIRILRRLAGGRSGAEVLDVMFKNRDHEASKVIKLGPMHELENEFHAHQQYLSNASAFFVPIEAATPGVLDKSMARGTEREAVVYDHAARFHGESTSQTQTFEDLAREAVQQGGPMLDAAIAALEMLFQGIKNDLYEKNEEQDTSLQLAWNRRLGIDAVVAADHIDIDLKMLETTMRARHGTTPAELRPRDIAQASVRVDHPAKPDDLVLLRGTRMVWWGDRLMAEVDTHHLRLEIVADGGTPIRQLAEGVAENSVWTIRGRLDALRARTHQERLLTGLDDVTLSDGILAGPGARVPNPFAVLPDVLESRRPHRLMSVIHGDLNPRNILVVGVTPCLIDYAFTRHNEPMLMDMARLEGLLTRDILAEDISWAQHVRLQRLLAAACRLGDEAADRFVTRLESERAELASAFRLLWTIRRAAREIYPPRHQSHWVRDYLEQLFLFAHLTLKWGSEGDRDQAQLRATAVMASVAAEALSETQTYRLWHDEAVREDGRDIIQLMISKPEPLLGEMANLARRLRRLEIKPDEPLKQDFETARSNLVKQLFRVAAQETINRLDGDHDVYISLKAYIDLKGQLRAGRRQQRRSLAEMLEDNDLLAEGERLREVEGSDNDVLRLIDENAAVILIGDAGSGKSTVAREWEYRLARSIVDGADDSHHSVAPRMPVVLRAPDLPERLKDWESDHLSSTVAILGHSERDAQLLAIGALYVIVDALNELADALKHLVADWIIALRNAFPSTPVLVCHRQYNYVPGLLPFPVITLQKVENEQARRYVHDYLREQAVPNHNEMSEQLIKLLLDDPEHQQVRDLAQTPLFLWMIVERFQQTQELPQSRGGLFDTFSRWYLEQRYHEAHQEQTETHYDYEAKARLLGVLGYEMVQRRATDLPEVDIPDLLPPERHDDWQAVRDEIISAEMLHRSDESLRFLHQSFQEYFAARHFLLSEASDPNAIRDKVWQFGWHDTFAVLLGFAGDATDVITRIIEEALRVNPLLTARCLRMAEQPDPRLFERFVTTQEAILQQAEAGAFSYERAARALAEHGRGAARAALWRTVTAVSAPPPSRVAALKRLAEMPAQARFEPVAGRIREEFVRHLPGIFDELAPIEVQQTAVDAIVSTALKDLGAYLADLVTAEARSLSRSAWRACEKLGVPIPARKRNAFVTACRDYLDQVEEELFQESVIKRMDDLNAERVGILQELATPANLPLLLNRRFSFRIHGKVADIIDHVASAVGDPPTDAQDAWNVLTEEPVSSPARK